MQVIANPGTQIPVGRKLVPKPSAHLFPICCEFVTIEGMSIDADKVGNAAGQALVGLGAVGAFFWLEFVALILGAAVGAKYWFCLIPVVMFGLYFLSQLKSAPSDALDDDPDAIWDESEWVEDD